MTDRAKLAAICKYCRQTLFTLPPFDEATNEEKREYGLKFREAERNHQCEGKLRDGANAGIEQRANGHAR